MNKKLIIGIIGILLICIASASGYSIANNNANAVE
jgi:hypothetical protein